MIVKFWWSLCSSLINNRLFSFKRSNFSCFVQITFYFDNVSDYSSSSLIVYILMELLRDSLVLTQFLVPNRKRYPITAKVFAKKCHTGLLWQWFQTTRKKYFMLVMENHQDNFPFEIGGPGSNFAHSQSRGLLLLISPSNTWRAQS